MSEIQNTDNGSLEALANAVCKRGLGLPALFFLEMYRPLTNVVGTFGEGFSPLIAPMIGRQRTRELVALLKDRDKYSQLIDLIETRMQTARKKGATHGC